MFRRCGSSFQNVHIGSYVLGSDDVMVKWRQKDTKSARITYITALSTCMQHPMVTVPWCSTYHASHQHRQNKLYVGIYVHSTNWLQVRTYTPMHVNLEDMSYASTHGLGLQAYSFDSVSVQLCKTTLGDNTIHCRQSVNIVSLRISRERKGEGGGAW